MTEEQKLLKQLVEIQDALETEQALFSCQGQGMDGYSALAEFQNIAKRARKLLGSPEPEKAYATPWEELGP